MKFTIKNETGDNVANIMRDVRYHYVGQTRERMNFVRPLSQNHYPRFHIYLKQTPPSRVISFSLHLDQKQPSYKGTTAHSGEYEGKLLGEEAKRIKQIFEKI